MASHLLVSRFHSCNVSMTPHINKFLWMANPAIHPPLFFHHHQGSQEKLKFLLTASGEQLRRTSLGSNELQLFVKRSNFSQSSRKCSNSCFKSLKVLLSPFWLRMPRFSLDIWAILFASFLQSEACVTTDLQMQQQSLTAPRVLMSECPKMISSMSGVLKALCMVQNHQHGNSGKQTLSHHNYISQPSLTINN